MPRFPEQPCTFSTSSQNSSIRRSSIIFFLFIAFQYKLISISSFTLKSPIYSSPSSSLPKENLANINLPRIEKLSSNWALFDHNPNNNGGPSSSFLKDKIQKLHVQMLETELARPPHHSPNLSPHNFIVEIMQALYTPHHPWNDSGFRVLLRSSTNEWRRSICHSIGVDIEGFHDSSDDDAGKNNDWDEDKIAQGLGKALSSSKNQFGILVGPSHSETVIFTNNLNDVSAIEALQNRNYKLTFPSDVVDFNDGTCWLECRLLDPTNGNLMVIMGWQLKRQLSDHPNINQDSRLSVHVEHGKSKSQYSETAIEHDGSWFIDGLDWQDFRDRYRPGLGREEWMRICG